MLMYVPARVLTSQLLDKRASAAPGEERGQDNADQRDFEGVQQTHQERIPEGAGRIVRDDGFGHGKAGGVIQKAVAEASPRASAAFSTLLMKKARNPTTRTAERI